jgi:hypothetical protein
MPPSSPPEKATPWTQNLKNLGLNLHTEQETKFPQPRDIKSAPEVEGNDAPNGEDQEHLGRLGRLGRRKEIVYSPILFTFVSEFS